MRQSKQRRKTEETDIRLSLRLEGEGTSSIVTGIGFFDHMLTLTAKHSLMDLEITCEGDLDVDFHHTVEDVGIVFGQALLEALGDKRGVRRYGTAYTPMDEALSLVVIDLSGRPYLHFEVDIPTGKVGEFDTELVEEFFRAVANQARATIHIRGIHGKNSHHIIESIFKGFGRALDEATAVDPRITGIRSTKGTL